MGGIVSYSESHTDILTRDSSCIRKSCFNYTYRLAKLYTY